MKGTSAPLMVSVIKTMFDTEVKIFKGESETRKTLDELIKLYKEVSSD